MLFKSAIGAALICVTATVFASSGSTTLSEFEPCRIGSSPTAVAAECASATVSFTHELSPQEPYTGSALPPTITLSIARIPSRSNQPALDPVTIIAGGPGQSAQDSWPQLQAAFYPVLAERDVYLIDQRGTGNSQRLDCPTPPADTGLTIDLQEIREAAAQCHASQPLATQWFTTSVAVRDLDAVRGALGYDHWNLYGVSYGTRVALHYLRRYPQHTRSVILDAVVAPSNPIGPELPVHAQDSLDALFDRCAMDDGCAEAFPGLADKTKTLFASLKAQPVQVQYENLTLGLLDSLTLDDKHLGSLVRLLSYSSYGTAILPSMLYDAAANNNFAPFARQTAQLTNQLSDSLAAGMHAAVICTEDAPFVDTSADRTALKNTYLGDFIIDSIKASCEHWPVGVIDDDFRVPVQGDTPVLALSGAVDPITPPAYAELAIEQLVNARHIVNRHQGHTQAPLGCIPTVMSRFIETANSSDLNLDCLERLVPPPLFIDANGPLP